MLYPEMFDSLTSINTRPKPFEFYTAPQLWNDPHISQKMLELHLDENTELASRTKVFIKNSAQWITSHFNLSSKSSLCDFGCGPGLYTTQFAENGISVTGIDFSECSINYARKTAIEKNLEIEYILQDYLEFNTDKRFDLITMIYCDFCALSPSQRKLLLNKFRSLLTTNGTIFLDVFSMAHYHATKEKKIYEFSTGNSFWSDEPYYSFLNTFKYEEEKLILDKWVLLEKMRTREIFNWMQCYSIESIKKEFQENGFNVTEYYSNVAGKPYDSNSAEIAIVAKKQ